MNTIAVIGWELRRILLTRTSLYSLLLVIVLALLALSRMIVHGVYGAAPYSQVSFAQYLVLLNPILLAILMLGCAAAFSEKQRAVRRIVLSTPISPAGLLGIQTAAIAAAFVLTSSAAVAACLIFFRWQFGYSAFGDYVVPLLAFWLPPAVFVLGLSMAAGNVHRLLPYGLLGLVFMTGFAYMGLPVWLDLCGNNFLLEYPKILMRTFGTGEMVFYLPANFVVSRVLFVAMGVGLLFWAAARKEA